MKRERPEDLHNHNHHHHPNNHHHHHHHHPHHHSNGIFSSTPHFPLHPPPPPPPHLRRSSTSDDTTDNTSYDSSSKLPPPPPSSSDGATIEVVRRPRGRPPGSKNKPKPPTPTPLHPPDSISEPSMGPYILELPPGVDLVDSTARFCRRRNVGLCILSGHGVVSNVSLKQPSATPGATVSFHGRFDILSISATVVPAGGLPAGNGAFTLFLAGPQGQVVGGLVVGPLMSAGTVYLIAATFESPMFVRLQPAEVEEDAPEEGDGGNHNREENGGGEGGGGGGMYSYQPADVIWAPTPRQPPAPPPGQY